MSLLKIRSQQMNVPIRFLLLFLYVVVSSGLALLFGGFNSNGPVQSLYIMASWTVIAYAAFSLSGLPLFLLIFVLYLSVLLCLNNCPRIRARFRLPLIPLLVHGIGITVCLLAPGRDENEKGFLINLLSWIIPMIVTFSYFILDCRLREGGKRP